MTDAATSQTTPPIAKRVPTTRTEHGDPVVDEYAWLRDRADPDTEAYLAAENGYCEQRTAHLGELRDAIFTEIKTRTQETDLSVPVRRGDWWYYTRTEEGKQYPAHCRSSREQPDAGDEQVLLDQNALAGDSDYFALGVFAVSPDGTLLAYATDHDGSETYTLRFRDLTTGADLPDRIDGVYYGAAWSFDGSTFFYTTLDPAMRPYRVWRHRLGAAQDDDELVYQEDDERFFVSVHLSRSKAYVFLTCGSSVTSEVRYLPADEPAGEFRLFQARVQDVEYDVEHAGDWFYVLHNAGARDFALDRVPVRSGGDREAVLAHRLGTRLVGVDAFVGHLVVSLRADGLTGLRILPLDGDTVGEPYDVAFDEPVYTVGTGANPEFDTATLRFGYTSLTTPTSVYDYTVGTGERVLKKRTPVLGDFDPAAYDSAREWASAPDGTVVPISLVWRKGTPRDGSAPCLLYGYGSYEASMDPFFSIPRLSLLDRGFVYAIAHVRGGGELGRQWYEDGKFKQKRNTFTDFVACAEHLVRDRWTSAPRIVARGGSAGGLLMGAVANLAPRAFGGILAHVPFVDTLNTILDPSLPLTVIEWEEWGNPVDDPSVYAYMKSYSPYENITATRYPPIFATAGLNDPRVGYHEPAKWVARLRATKTDGNELLLKTEMGAGHGGKSGRYDAWRDEALYLAWAVEVASAGTS